MVPPGLRVRDGVIAVNHALPTCTAGRFGMKDAGAHLASVLSSEGIEKDAEHPKAAPSARPNAARPSAKDHSHKKASDAAGLPFGKNPH